MAAREPDIQLTTRSPAPSLEGGVEWLNTAGPLDLRQLRGKLVILDFWTYCCINCIHTLPELKKLEAAYPNEVVVIGVHSPKFVAERESENIREAILRYKIQHPVVNDAGQVLWRKFGVQAWPSLRIIDPQGYLIASHMGEATFEQLDRFVRRTLATYRRRGAVDPTPLRFELERNRQKPTPLLFPGKVLADKASDRLFISDHGHHRIIVTRLDGTLVDVIGSGQQGLTDGDYISAQFDHPQGMALVGSDLYVADTENHAIRKVDLETKQVTTAAGTGEPASQTVVRLAGIPQRTPLSSPWALTVAGDQMYIAMAGKHQIWAMTLDGRRIFPYAGSGKEDIIDGTLLPPRPAQEGFAAFAQPTGITSDENWLYVADSEGSSIRAVPIGRREPVRTIVGTALLPADRLFTFGDIDGPFGAALLQHPMGVAKHADKLFITDTYNNKIKVLDLTAGTIATLVGHPLPGDSDEPPRFNEPTGLAIAGETIFVADTNNHSIRKVDLAAGRVTTLIIKGLEAPQPVAVRPPELANAKRTNLPMHEVKLQDGRLRFEMSLTMPFELKLNRDVPLHVEVTSPDSDLFEKGTDVVSLNFPVPAEGPLKFAVPVAASEGSFKLQVSLVYFYCQPGDAGLCRTGGVIWSGRCTISEDGSEDPIKLSHVVTQK